MISIDYDKSYEDGRKMLQEHYKTCGRCVHDGVSRRTELIQALHKIIEDLEKGYDDFMYLYDMLVINSEGRRLDNIKMIGVSLMSDGSIEPEYIIKE